MIYKSEFRVSILHLNSITTPDRMLEAHKNNLAKSLGIEICKNIPITLNKERSFNREQVPSFKDATLPMLMQPPEEVYQTEVFAVSADDWRSFKNRLYTLIAPVAHRHLIVDLVKDLQSGTINKTAQQQ